MMRFQILIKLFDNYYKKEKQPFSGVGVLKIFFCNIHRKAPVKKKTEKLLLCFSESEILNFSLFKFVGFRNKLIIYRLIFTDACFFWEVTFYEPWSM